MLHIQSSDEAEQFLQVNYEPVGLGLAYFLFVCVFVCFLNYGPK